MTVPPEVSLQTVTGELAAAKAYAAAAGISLDDKGLSTVNLKFYAEFRNADNERFYAEFDCADYPYLPPYIEFIDEARRLRGNKPLYPACFHGTPCVCMRYNRKAYAINSGPHADWRMVDWQLPTDGGGPIRTLAEMISDLYAKISDSRGRL